MGESTLIYFLPEIVRRSTVEDTSYSTFPAITPILSLCFCFFVSYLEPSNVNHMTSTFPVNFFRV